MRKLLALLSLAITACNSPTANRADQQRSASPVVPAASASEKRSAPRVSFDQIQQAQTLGEAISVARPLMADRAEQVSRGAVLLAIWGMKKMKWADVAVQVNETSHAAAMKDSEQQRGKRLCITARLAMMQISHFGQGDVYHGILRTADGDLYQYEAVGSTEDLGDTGTLCGVVTGTFEYTSASGVVHTAVQIVGMFDLPVNRRS